MASSGCAYGLRYRVTLYVGQRLRYMVALMVAQGSRNGQFWRFCRPRKGLIWMTEILRKRGLVIRRCNEGERLYQAWCDALRLCAQVGSMDEMRAYYTHKNGVTDKNGKVVRAGCEMCRFEMTPRLNRDPHLTSTLRAQRPFQGEELDGGGKIERG